MTRLLKEANGMDTVITVEKDLQLYEDDRIALLSSSYENGASDYRIVDSYDPKTGEVTLKLPLMYYHWGKLESTAKDYNGVDMRTEVLILSRNVMIAGQDIESWGGQIVTSDSIEATSSGEIIFRKGQTVLHNVEIYNCS